MATARRLAMDGVLEIGAILKNLPSRYALRRLLWRVRTAGQFAAEIRQLHDRGGWHEAGRGGQR